MQQKEYLTNWSSQFGFFLTSLVWHPICRPGLGSCLAAVERTSSEDRFPVPPPRPCVPYPALSSHIWTKAAWLPRPDWFVDHSLEVWQHGSWRATVWEAGEDASDPHCKLQPAAIQALEPGILLPSALGAGA